MTPNERLSFSIRSVALLKCLKTSGFFPSSEKVELSNGTAQDEKPRENLLSQNELYIARLLFHFQTGIQYNLHAIYQVIIEREDFVNLPRIKQSIPKYLGPVSFIIRIFLLTAFQ